jgi:hypothetical protein
MDTHHLQSQRASAALQNLFVADALAMPVHWFYSIRDIEKAFPGGVRQLEPAPQFHPSSIMSLHSTSSGGRRTTDNDGRPTMTDDGRLTTRRTTDGGTGGRTDD